MKRNKFRLTLYWIGLFSFIRFCSVGFAASELSSDLSFSNPAVCESLLLNAQHALIGAVGDPVAKLREEFGPEINDSKIEHGLYQFESDILGLFELAPEHRDLGHFAEKWKLGEQELLDVLAYYGTHVFYNDLRVAGDPQVLARRLRSLSFQHFLRFSDHPAATHYDYYVKHITKKSVPELALDLGISEGQVYRELWMTGLSIGEQFSKACSSDQFKAITERLVALGHADKSAQLEPAMGLIGMTRKLMDLGLSIENIAAALDVGEQALRFFSHHAHLTNRGVSWDRIGEHEEKHKLETEILIDLYEQGFSRAEIAQVLNRIFKTTKPTDIDIRTEASVSYKFHELFKDTSSNGSSKTIYDPRYGYLKQNGKLIETTVSLFLADHAGKSKDWIEQKLEITKPELTIFMQNSTQRSASKQTKELLDRYAAQKDAVEKVIGWTVAKGRAPHATDFGMGPGKVGVPFEKFSATGYYKVGAGGNRKARTHIFDSSSEAWIVVKRQAEREGIEMRLIDITIHSPSEEVRLIRQ